MQNQSNNSALFSNTNSNTSLQDELNENSNSNSNSANDSFNKNNSKKKPVRDPYAHRRVEKTRRDRMNCSLNRLSSLIPESFRKQANQGNTRVDKIKIVDIAILYVEHLQELLNKYNQEKEKKETESKKANDNDSEKNDDTKSKKSVETSTHDLNEPSNTIIGSNLINELDLFYVKGLFNGSLEFISYLIEFSVLNPTSYSQPTQQQQQNRKKETFSNRKNDSASERLTDQINALFNIEFYINILRKFHSIYFNKLRLSDEQIKFVIEKKNSTSVKPNQEQFKKQKSPKPSLSFPYNNTKIIKKVLHALSSYSFKQSLPFKFYKKIYKCIINNQSLTKNQTNETSPFSLPGAYESDNSESSTSSSSSTSLLSRTSSSLSLANSDKDAYTSMSCSSSDECSKVSNLNSAQKKLRKILSSVKKNRSKNSSSGNIHSSLLNNQNNNTNININDDLESMCSQTSNTVSTKSTNLTTSLSAIDQTLQQSRNDQCQPSQAQALGNDTSPQQQYIRTAKKLKSNLIERFTTNNSLVNSSQPDIQEIYLSPPTVTPPQIATIGNFDSKKKADTDNDIENENMLSIFILHSSHDFYVSGCMDETLLSESILKNCIKNSDFKPKSVQKIKLDVVFNSDIIIKNSRPNIASLPKTYDLFPVPSIRPNKRKYSNSNKELLLNMKLNTHNQLFDSNKSPNKIFHSSNLTEENRILESYLKAVHKAHENKKRQSGFSLNSSNKSNNADNSLTILYKNYSRSANLEYFSKNDEDQMSERTFYSV